MEMFHNGDDSLDATAHSARRDPHGFFSPAGRALGHLVGPRVKWLVVVVAVLVSAAAFAFAGAGQVAPGQNSLPDSAESAEVAALQATLPASGVAPAILVVSRADGPLTEADQRAVVEATERASKAVSAAGAAPRSPGAQAAPGGQGGPGDQGDQAGPGGPGGAKPQVSEDGGTALALVPLSSDVSDEVNGKAVDALRAAVRDGLPEGLTASVTGGPAFTADIGKVFDGADVRLLGATAGVVALLLLVTYRSPWLWLVPLSVVGVGDQVASRGIDILSRFSEVSADGAVKGIVSVLVFGAGTNYALLLIARYREELRRVDDRHDAMRRALASAAPAILASSSTVVLALLSLGFADDRFVVSLGYAGALGIVVALAYALLVLPAAMVLFGRRLFWPFVPRMGQEDPSRTGLWRRVGDAVTGRPVTVGVAAVLVLGALTAGGVGLAIGQTPTEQFLDKPEAVVGQEQLAKAFPAGSGEPAVVIAPSGRATEVRRTVEAVDGVSTARPGAADARWTELSVVLEGAPGSSAAFDQVESLRAAVDGAGAKVGGSDAELLDARATADRDRLLLFPVILGIVLVVLLLLLRSVVAAVVLVATVLATYVASMGASWFAFSHLLGYPPLDVSTPLLAFLFLVALGVDYNIFLTTRAREEAAEGQPAREAIVRALAVTGGVFTSAGILLAAVFAVLGVLPLVQLAQIGVIVGFGVLLDTLVVRSIVVPALVTVLGERFWWPSHPGTPSRAR
ncbi:putative drug exporter of the RND superfamily [Pedococcus dokdonensis]|uniref:Putative drug exporter of the RND superfamily n=1 Tax=Pedococcus dokdonensis TaxID=443156 RepID=A0A1H0UD03_9MICO|nr:MMPL family transporter [Pedococcus dokdonensis]SDP63940.1 putative drug exporter of the RND superfamily [Pedococcus dokdonensis]